mmetsp:Transcript_15213/g.62249  ORF Transcript_15213/g.62249 Transcript_15213/m.62249 type:complete len:122 (+) Transcript_15213:48-413(+)
MVKEPIYTFRKPHLTCNSLSCATSEFQTRTLINTLKAGQGTIFPQGLPHFQINNSCKPAQFFAALSDEDPGAVNFPDSIYNFPENLLQTIFAVNQPRIDRFRNDAMMREISRDCRRRCGLD